MKEIYLKYPMKRKRSVYYYQILVKTEILSYHMRFPFVNSRDWVHIIAESVQMDYQRINLNTAKPDESIELWNISTEFYPLKSLPPDREDIILQLDPHSVKSFGNTNIIVTIRSMYEPNSVYINPPIPKIVEQFWKGCIQFSNQNLIHVISLQGEYQEISIQTKEKNTAATLNVYWLQTTNQKFHSYRDTQWAKGFINHICLNYVTADTPPYGLDSMDFTFIYHKEKNTTYNGIWLEAYELCNHCDGYLPIFHSREEIDQLISVLKLPQNPPTPIKFMFIGLITHQVSKVSTKG